MFETIVTNNVGTMYILTLSQLIGGEGGERERNKKDVVRIGCSDIQRENSSYSRLDSFRLGAELRLGDRALLLGKAWGCGDTVRTSFSKKNKICIYMYIYICIYIQ